MATKLNAGRSRPSGIDDAPSPSTATLEAKQRESINVQHSPREDMIPGEPIAESGVLY